MKRARKEVFDHLRENGYKVSYHTEIIGFLMGVGILTPKKDHISIRAKDNGGDLYDFIEWYNNKGVKRDKKGEEKSLKEDPSPSDEAHEILLGLSLVQLHCLEEDKDEDYVRVTNAMEYIVRKEL